MRAPPSDYEMALHCARVYIAEARRRRNQTFGFTLLTWAGNARRRAMASRLPEQRDMFGQPAGGDGAVT